MPLLELKDVHKIYGKGATQTHAVRGVSLEVDYNNTLGLVGESGSGKTTIARLVAGLAAPSRGFISLDGADVPGNVGKPEFRQRIQMVFQNPAGSLNPRFRIDRIVAEPVRRLGIARADQEVRKLVDRTLEAVGLDQGYGVRRPGQLSGGQQQRVAIARALISKPDLLVLDEPTSSLDQSVQSRILSLLDHIQQEEGIAYLLISHDLRAVERVAGRVAVMYAGRIVELADTDAIFQNPQHPYTEALLSAIPRLDPEDRRKRIVLPGNTPSPADLPTGCAFQDRCPLVHHRCRVEEPTLKPVDSGHMVECFAVEDRAAIRDGRN